ncbi:PilZ domain-containing protein [Sphingomonas sp. MMS12-HWE2-04]|uniref:PilZ domain-containing protein n=1 Tax=Sphingomonas sp. MMS12-HWE2-04 TaxID=3234199 RepID=UPI00384EA5FD
MPAYPLDMATQFRPAPFAAEIAPMLAIGKRGHTRVPVSFDAQFGQDGLDRTLCRVTDISQHGARLQTYSALRAGSLIWLSLPGLGHHVARIAWADDFSAGVEFRTPLSDAIFEALTAQ